MPTLAGPAGMPEKGVGLGLDKATIVSHMRTWSAPSGEYLRGKQEVRDLDNHGIQAKFA